MWTGCVGLYFSNNLVVEIDVVILVRPGPKFHGGTGVLVLLTGDVIGYKRPPLQGLAQLHEMVLQQFPNRASFELGVAEKADE